jgi:hypothetical protein
MNLQTRHKKRASGPQRSPTRAVLSLARQGFASAFSCPHSGRRSWQGLHEKNTVMQLLFYENCSSRNHVPRTEMTIAVCASSRPIYIIANRPQASSSKSWQLVCGALVFSLLVLLLAESSSTQHGQRLIVAKLWARTDAFKTDYPQGPDAALWPEEARRVSVTPCFRQSPTQPGA